MGRHSQVNQVIDKTKNDTNMQIFMASTGLERLMGKTNTFAFSTVP